MLDFDGKVPKSLVPVIDTEKEVMIENNPDIKGFKKAETPKINDYNISSGNSQMKVSSKELENDETKIKKMYPLSNYNVWTFWAV